MPADLDTAPPSPLTAEIRDGLDFIEARLLQPVTVQGAAMQAIAETAQPFNDSHWYWTDDKPRPWSSSPCRRCGTPSPRSPTVLDFVLAMSPGEAIWRRLAAPQLQARRLDPKDSLVVTPFHSFEGDLSRGLLRQSVRFNDGRERVAAVHTGHLVEFRSAAASIASTSRTASPIAASSAPPAASRCSTKAPSRRRPAC